MVRQCLTRGAGSVCLHPSVQLAPCSGSYGWWPGPASRTIAFLVFVKEVGVFSEVGHVLWGVHNTGQGMVLPSSRRIIRSFRKQICDTVLFRWGVCERKNIRADSITLGASLAHAVPTSLVVSYMLAGCMHLISGINTAPRSSFFWVSEALHSQVAGFIGIFKYSFVTHHDDVCTYLSVGPKTSTTCTTAIAQPPGLLLPKAIMLGILNEVSQAKQDVSAVGIHDTNGNNSKRQVRAFIANLSSLTDCLRNGGCEQGHLLAQGSPVQLNPYCPFQSVSEEFCTSHGKQHMARTLVP